MKLKVEKGELNLPKDFSFEIEQNSAFFSDDGAASIAATIPATPADMEKLGHPTRIARDTRYVNLFPAILSHGTFQKHGNLVVTSASKDGITCAMALEDSELYSKYKDMNIRELFGDNAAVRGSGVDFCCDKIDSIYRRSGRDAQSNLYVFPVAVNFNAEENTYQINNEPQYRGGSGIWPLLCEPRVIDEGGSLVTVPKGYGLAPFLLLSRFLELLFSYCGYSVIQNCFEREPLNKLVLLHQCSDVVCNGYVKYKDIIPSKTVSEIIEWLRNKFHAQIVVRPAQKQLDIILMQDILQGGFDVDLTKKLLGNLTFSFSEPSRVVLAPDNSLEGAAPPTETLQELKQKYGSVTVLDEEQWDSFTGQGLVYRKSTGMYYEILISKNGAIRAYAGDVIHRTVGGSTHSTRPRGSSGYSGNPASSGAVRYSYRESGKNAWDCVGSNYFTRDRKSTADAEDFSPSDIMPPMVFVNGMLMPYIGERKHRNTTYQESDIDDDQEIMVCEYAGESETCNKSSQIHIGADNQRAYAGGHYHYGTTQAYNNAGTMRQGGHDLSPEGLFPLLFSRYHQVLQNNRIEISGQFDLSIPEIQSYQMYQMKLMNGQFLLPSYLRYEVGRKIRCLEARFFLVKEFSDAITEEDISLPEPSFKWELNNSDVESLIAQVKARHPDVTVDIGLYSDEEEGDEPVDVFLPSPTALGQTSPRFVRKVKAGYYRRYGPDNTYFVEVEGGLTVDVWFDSAAI